MLTDDVGELRLVETGTCADFVELLIPPQRLHLEAVEINFDGTFSVGLAVVAPRSSSLRPRRLYFCFVEVTNEL